MSKIEEGLNKKFGRLKPIEIIKEKGKQAKYRCLCDCGKEIVTQYYNLYIGKTQSCGCLSNEKRHEKNKPNHYKKHGLSGHRLSVIRNGMISRCYNQKADSYNAYGGRGIKICDEWKNKETGMLNFYNWAVANGYKDGLTIERIDVDGNYCPENCTWITPKEQYYNKRPYDYDEQKKHALFNRELISLLKDLGFNHISIRQRMRKYGVTLEEALTLNNKKSRKLEIKNEYLQKYIDKKTRVEEREKIISKIKSGEITK